MSASGHRFQLGNAVGESSSMEFYGVLVEGLFWIFLCKPDQLKGSEMPLRWGNEDVSWVEPSIEEFCYKTFFNFSFFIVYTLSF